MSASVKTSCVISEEKDCHILLALFLHEISQNQISLTLPFPKMMFLEIKVKQKNIVNTKNENN